MNAAGQSMIEGGNRRRLRSRMTLRAGRFALPALVAALLAVLPGVVSAQAGGKEPPPIPDEVKARMPMGGKSPRIPTTFDELFAERDARAVDALNYLRCLRVTLRAVQVGALGQVPRAWLMTCVEQGSEWRGVFSEASDTEQGFVVRKQFALRGNGQVVTDFIDTARVAGVSRALLRGVAATPPGKGTYEFLPVPLPQPTFIEVWFLPVPSDPLHAITGGDSLIQMSADGTRELGHSRTSPPIRSLSVREGATYTLASREERIPLLSELMLAHMALSIAPEVRVATVQYESIFSSTSPNVRHVQR